MKKVYFEDIPNLDEVIEVCIQKNNGLLDKSWREIVEEFDLDMKPEALSRFAKYISIYREHLISCGDTESMEILQEIKKEKIKLADQRRELMRVVRESARKDNVIEIFEESLKNRVPVMAFEEESFTLVDYPQKNRECVVHISDVHYGIGVDNELNYYDTKVCKESFRKLFYDTIEVLNAFNTNVVTVVLGGDLISGIIHTNLRLQQVEDTITQVLSVADLIEEFCLNLKALGVEIKRVVGTIGNHSRVMADKKQNLSDENFERIVFKQLEKAGFEVLQESDVAIFEVAGNIIAALHGDQTTPENAYTYVIKRKGVIPKAILMAHLHSDIRVDKGCPVIVNGGMVGADEYAIEKGYCSTPHQKILIFEENVGEVNTFKSTFTDRKKVDENVH